MGAYENPITTIDTESSKIIDNALNNVSASFQKAMYNKQELESKKIQQAQKQEIQDQNKINANYERFVTNVSKSGTRSDAFYSMGYDLINRKFAANRAFQNANPGSEEKNEARNQVGTLTKDLVLLTQGAGGIDEMNTETANIRNARNNNTPGGYYLGPKYDVGLDNVSFDDLSFEQKVARTMHERNAMFENKAGYKMNNGQLFGVDENNRAFNLETTDGREIPKIENWGESLRKDFDKLGIMKNGKMSEEYLNRKASATFTEGNITGTIIPTNMAAAAGDWSTELKKKAAGVVNSAQGWDDYATNNATYLSFAGKDAEDLEYDGDYLLTDKSKIKYTEAMVSFGLKKFLKQYEIEDINEVENYDEYLSDKDETYTSIEGKENFGARRVGEKEKKLNKTSTTLNAGRNYTKTEEEAILTSANIATAGNVFNIPSNKAGDKMSPDAEINIPATDNEDYAPFKKNLKVLGFKIDPMYNGKKGKFKKQLGYFIGNNREANSKQFEIKFDDKTTGRDFYRDLFVNLNVPQSEIETRLNAVFSNLEKTNAEATYQKRAKEDQDYVDSGGVGSSSNKNPASSNLPGG